MIIAALVSGAIAIGLFGGMVDLLIVTWPDFGAALLAVPILLGVLAFGTVCVTSFRVLADPGVVPPLPTARPSTPTAPGQSLQT